MRSPDLVVAPAPEPHFAYHLSKRLIDVALSAVALLAAAPLVAAVALAIRLESGGPVFYRQERLGLGGRPFEMLKLRSMKAGLEDERPRDAAAGVTYKTREDPRLTRVGRWIRRTSLDEAPQFWNVLRGEMSIVGPRPFQRRTVESIGGPAVARLAVKPGLTCIWQVSGRNEIEQDRWMELDARYIAERSLKRDLELIAGTPAAVLSGRGAF
jgi:lipopolysaccharide/colanic/teichoic acid biosynthesis glycosyltransferase